MQNISEMFADVLVPYFSLTVVMVVSDFKKKKKSVHAHMLLFFVWFSHYTFKRFSHILGFLSGPRRGDKNHARTPVEHQGSVWKLILCVLQA